MSKEGSTEAPIRHPIDFENPNLYKFDLQTKKNYIANFDKLRLNHYYFRKHKWNIIEYENDKDSKINNQMKYLKCLYLKSHNFLNHLEF